MKKLTAKELLLEIQSIKKQASPSLCKPATIQYEQGDDVESLVENAINDTFYGWGVSGVSSMTISNGIAYVEGTYSCEVEVEDTTEWWKSENGTEIADSWVSDASGGFLNSTYGFEGLSDPMLFGSWFTDGNSPDDWIFGVEPLETGMTESDYKDVKKRLPFVKYYESLKWHPGSGNHRWGYSPKLTGDLGKDEKIIKSLTKEFVKDLKKINRMFNSLSEEDQELFGR